MNNNELKISILEDLLFETSPSYAYYVEDSEDSEVLNCAYTALINLFILTKRTAADTAFDFFTRLLDTYSLDTYHSNFYDVVEILRKEFKKFELINVYEQQNPLGSLVHELDQKKVFLLFSFQRRQSNLQSHVECIYAQDSKYYSNANEVSVEDLAQMLAATEMSILISFERGESK